MNDSTSVRASMSSVRIQVNHATVDKMYDHILAHCTMATWTGAYECLYKLTPYKNEPYIVACLDHVVERLRAQGFEVPYIAGTTRHILHIKWGYPTVRISDATRLLYLSLSKGPDAAYHTGKLLYKEIMGRCYARAAEHHNYLDMSHELLIEANDQAALLLVGWDVTVANLKQQDFQIVEVFDTTPTTIIIIW